MEMHIKYCRLFIEIFKHKAVGDDGPTMELFGKLCDEIGKEEVQFELYFDFLIYTSNLMRIVNTQSNLSDLVTL